MVAVCPLVNETLTERAASGYPQNKNMKLKDINGLRDLEHYGISVLTGERDNLLLGRLLCDLNEEGCFLLIDYFGLNSETPFQRNWNSRVGAHPAIGSIMLTSEVLWELAVFALLKAGAKFVYRDDHNGRVTHDDGEIWAAIDDSWEDALKKFSGSTQEKAGMSSTAFCKETVPDYLQVWKRYRNLGANFQVHAFSGRS